VLYPFLAALHWPANTRFDISRAYSAAANRFKDFINDAKGPSSGAKDSAQ